MTVADSGNGPQETLELIASDLYGGEEEEVFQVIRSAGELNKFYRKVNMTRKPGLPVLEIDFSKHTAVLYCSGSTTTEQIPSLRIAAQSDSQVQLMKSKLTDEPGQNTSSAKLTPFGLYILPFTDNEVILRQNK